MYNSKVINIFNNPQNAGRISKPDGIASCFNLDNTAHVEFSLRIDSGIIKDCKFRAQANPYIIAVCSTITNMVRDKMCSLIFLEPYTIKAELEDENNIDIEFCIDCFKLAVQDYKEKLEKETKPNKKLEEDQEEIQVNTEFPEVEEKVEESEVLVSEPKGNTGFDSDSGDDFDFSDFFDDEDF